MDYVTLQGAFTALSGLAADAFSYPERCQQLHTPFTESPDCVQGAPVGAGRPSGRCPAAWLQGGTRWLDSVSEQASTSLLEMAGQEAAALGAQAAAGRPQL